jgi:hypothetical protein
MNAGTVLRRVINVRRGAIVPNANGIRTYAFAVLVLECGHEILSSRARGLNARVPRRARCPYHEAGK